MDLDVLPNAQCTQFHGKWAEKDRNFGVTLMIEPVFMRATREGVKIIVVPVRLVKKSTVSNHVQYYLQHDGRYRFYLKFPYSVDLRQKRL